MNRIGNTKLPKGLSLELQQLLPAMVHGAADPAILPARMLQPSQFAELSANLVGSPSFLRESQVPVHIGTTLHQLLLKIRDGSRNLLVNLAAHPGSAEEYRVAPPADGKIDVADAAEKTIATERVEGLARVSKNEEYKYNIANARASKVCRSVMIVAGRGE